MSLLVDLSTDALAPGYAAAAARKRAAGVDERPRWPLVGATVVAATLVVVIAAVQTRASAPAAAKSRSALVAAVNRQSATVDRLERTIATLSAEQAALRDASLASTSAGAEGSAVNGERLTAQSAIRQAGDAILVDFRPLVSPYVVTAIGPPVDIETKFGASSTAERMRGLAQLEGLRFDYSRASHLTLPAAPDATLHYARPVAAPSPRGRS